MDIDEAIEEYNKLSKACNVVFPQTRNYKQIANWLEQLKDYQQLDEQGRLVKLPCKIGDTVYLIKSNETIVERVADMMFLGVLWEEFGKEWFLTKAEAEAKLKELRGGE